MAQPKAEAPDFIPDGQWEKTAAPSPAPDFIPDGQWEKHTAEAPADPRAVELHGKKYLLGAGMPVAPVASGLMNMITGGARAAGIIADAPATAGSSGLKPMSDAIGSEVSYANRIPGLVEAAPEAAKAAVHKGLEETIKHKALGALGPIGRWLLKAGVVYEGGKAALEGVKKAGEYLE